jgi:predicted DNA-binding protein (UPF0251 family)
MEQAMTADSPRAPRPYSRLETDDELLSRLAALRVVKLLHETVEQAAARYGLQRRILWVDPPCATEARR